MLAPLFPGRLLTSRHVPQVGLDHGDQLVRERLASHRLLVRMRRETMGQALDRLYDEEAGVLQVSVADLGIQPQKSRHGLGGFAFRMEQGAVDALRERRLLQEDVLETGPS